MSSARHGGANFLTSFGERLAVKSEPMDASRWHRPAGYNLYIYIQSVIRTILVNCSISMNYDNIYI